MYIQDRLSTRWLTFKHILRGLDSHNNHLYSDSGQRSSRSKRESIAITMDMYEGETLRKSHEQLQSTSDQD